MVLELDTATLGTAMAPVPQEAVGGRARYTALKKELLGRLILPSETDYDAARRVWVASVDRYPAAIVRAQIPADVSAAVRFAREEGLPLAVIGGGSNLLVADRGVRGLVVVYRNERDEVEAVEEDGTVRVTAPAQIGLSKLGRYCCERGWAGLD